MPVVVVLIAASATAGTVVGPGVSAAFTGSAVATSGSLSMATLTGTFADGVDGLGDPGGHGGRSYAMPAGASDDRYTTLTNTGTAPASYTGTVTAVGLTGDITIEVDACTVVWSGGLCPGTTTSLLAPIGLSSVPVVAYGALAVSEAEHLRFRFDRDVGASATSFLATVVAAGVAGDRTSG